MSKLFPRAPLAKRIRRIIAAEKEDPVVTVREWLKILIPLFALGALVLTTRQLSI